MKIYINDTEIEHNEPDFTLKFALSELEDITARKAFKTSTIKVPATDLNKTVFDFIEDISVRFPDQPTGQIESGAFTFRGYVKIYDSTIEDGSAYYNFQIVSSDWLSELRGVKLADLDWSDQDHTVNASNITTSETASSSRAYVYGLFDYGDFYDDEDIRCIERVPTIRVSDIINKSFSQVGYSLSSDSFDGSDYFIFDLKKQMLNDKDFGEDKPFKAFGTASQTFTKTLSSSASNQMVYFFGATSDEGQIEFNNTSGIGAYSKTNNYNTSTSKYTVNEAGAFNFQIKIIASISEEGTGWSDEEFYGQIKIYKNGAEWISDTAQAFSDAGASFTLTRVYETSFRHLEVDDYIEVYFKCYDSDGVVQNSGRDQDITLTISSSSFFMCDADPRRGIDYSLGFSDLMPDTYAIDFIKQLTKVFNLYFYANPFTKEITIKQGNDFYQATTKEWTDKLDLDGQIKITKYIAPKNIKYGYTSDDDINVSELDIYSVETFETENPVQEVINELSYTHFGLCRRIGLETTSVPVLWKDSFISDPTAGYTADDWGTDFNTRILKYVERENTSDSWTFEGTASAYVPKFEAYAPADIKANYSGLHKNMELSKALEADFNLNDLDIADLINGGMNKPILIDIAGLRGYYYLIEIIGYSVNRIKNTRVKLLQVSDNNY